MRPPAATPPLATAKYDISLAAMEPAAIPAGVNPSAARTAGARATVPAPPEYYFIYIFKDFQIRSNKNQP